MAQIGRPILGLEIGGDAQPDLAGTDRQPGGAAQGDRRSSTASSPFKHVLFAGRDDLLHGRDLVRGDLAAFGAGSR